MSKSSDVKYNSDLEVALSKRDEELSRTLDISDALKEKLTNDLKSVFRIIYGEYFAHDQTGNSFIYLDNKPVKPTGEKDLQRIFTDLLNRYENFLPKDKAYEILLRLNQALYHYYKMTFIEEGSDLLNFEGKPITAKNADLNEMTGNAIGMFLRNFR